MKDDTEETEGALAAIIEKHNEKRPFTVFPVDSIFNANGQKMEIAFRLLMIGEEDDAIRLAYKHLAEEAKTSGDGAEGAKKDENLSISANALEALERACRSVAPGGGLGRFDAFPGGSAWMRKNLRQDQVLALYNLYLATKRKFALAPHVLEDGAVDALVPKLADVHSDIPPEVWLASYDRGDMVNLAVLLAVRISGAVEAVKLLSADRDEAEEALKAERAQVALLEERIAELLAEREASTEPEVSAAPEPAE